MGRQEWKVGDLIVFQCSTSIKILQSMAALMLLYIIKCLASTRTNSYVHVSHTGHDWGVTGNRCSFAFGLTYMLKFNLNMFLKLKTFYEGFWTR